jgi:predicted acylesterase/phospholipase RssA
MALGGRRVLAVDVSTDDLISRGLRLTKPFWHRCRPLEMVEPRPRGELTTSIAHLRRSAALAATIPMNSAHEDALPGAVIYLKVNSGISTFDFSRAAPAICAGELAALEIVNDIRGWEDVRLNGVDHVAAP